MFKLKKVLRDGIGKYHSKIMYNKESNTASYIFFSNKNGDYDCHEYNNNQVGRQVVEATEKDIERWIDPKDGAYKMSL